MHIRQTCRLSQIKTELSDRSSELFELDSPEMQRNALLIERLEKLQAESLSAFNQRNKFIVFQSRGLHVYEQTFEEGPLET